MIKNNTNNKGLPKLSAFELRIKYFPPELKNEIIEIDKYLVKDMEKGFKFKRAVDKYGIITYTSPWGFRYKIRRFEAGELHDIMWNKRNYVVEMLNILAQKSPAFANRIFNENIHTHTNMRVCPNCHFPDCKNITTLEYDGKIKKSCGSAIQFKWFPSEFEDVRKIVAAINEVVKEENTREKI